MKKTLTLLSLTVAALAQPLSAHADIAFNAGTVSEYRYRGLSQTRLQPAVQAGVDFSDGGFYLGAWSSTIRWIISTRSSTENTGCLAALLSTLR